MSPGLADLRSQELTLEQQPRLGVSMPGTSSHLGQAGLDRGQLAGDFDRRWSTLDDGLRVAQREEPLQDVKQIASDGGLHQVAGVRVELALLQTHQQVIEVIIDV